MKAIILCAGYATRLYPITLDFPKHLLEINNKPILEFIYDKINKISYIDEIIVVTNNKFYPNFRKWADSIDKNIKVINDNTNNDNEKLGGIGDLHFVINKSKINDDLLIILGDNFFEFDLKKFVNFAIKTNKVILAGYDINDFEEAKRFGVLKINDKNILLDFQEKPENPSSSLISTGIYFFPKKKIKFIYDYMKTNENKDGPGYLIKSLCPRKEVFVYVFKEPWYDIGTLKQYKSLQEKYSKS